jgi:hypothetical protein
MSAASSLFSPMFVFAVAEQPNAMGLWMIHGASQRHPGQVPMVHC